MKNNKILTILLLSVLTLVSLIMLYPFIWMFLSSFKSNLEIVQDPLSLVPKKFTLEGYNSIKTLSGNSLWHYFKNSLIISIGTTIIVVISTSLGGYALFRKSDLPLFRFVERGFMISVMYPAVLLLIPLFVIVNKFNMYGTNNYIGIILASSTGAWGAALPFFLFRNFFSSIPFAIIEAANIDGATEVQLLTKIVMPLMMPVVGTAVLISFLSNWGAWLPVLMLSKDMSTYTLSSMLVNLNSELGVDLSKTAALSTIITLPVVIVFLITQKKVLDGIAAGSVK